MISGPQFWAPVAILTLLVLSAAITGFLVFGYPVMKYLDGHKEEALTELGKTLGWLAAIVVVVWGGMFLLLR